MTNSNPQTRSMPLRKVLLASACVIVCTSALLLARLQAPSSSAPGMTAAADAFLSSLNDQQRAIATFKFDDAERLNWHFIPRERKGLPLKDLEGKRLKAAHKLLASSLSEAGYEQALNIMSLEELLYLLEGGNRETRRAKRDPQKYYISVFGKPGPVGKWGWRFEGHHLSLNYTLEDGKLVSTTPEFFGTNPGSVDAGPGRRIRVLGPEEDIARKILKISSAAAKQKIWIDKKAPGDLRGGGIAQPETTAPVGLAYGEMSDDQKKLVHELLNEYLQNMPSDVEQQRRNMINSDGMDSIHFAWWGSSEINEPHYYRVQGKSFLVEYNNVQNKANHVHSIWRNLSGDFNISL